MRVAILILPMILTLAVSSRGQGGNYSSQVFGPTGSPRGGVTITVCTSAGTGVPCTPLATIYTDSTLTTQAQNPFQTDALGNFSFWAPPGIYRYTATGAGLTNTSQPYTVAIACVPLGVASCAAQLNQANTWTASQSFSLPIISTVSTGTAPLTIASTTVVPNLNASSLNGKTAPNGTILGTTDTQAETNKTLTSPTVTNPSTTGTDSGTETLSNKMLTSPVINGASTGTGMAGTDSTLLTAGTVSGTGAALCTDANGGATTSGCTPGGVTESTLSTGAFAVSWNVPCTAGSTGHCAYTTFAKAHTLVRITYDLTQAPSSCVTNAVVGVRDVTSSTNVSTITAPLDSWIALTEDETRITATGATYEEVSKRLDDAGDKDSIILKTPSSWLTFAV